jgi:cytidine deaminase
MSVLNKEKLAQLAWLAVTARDQAYAPYSSHPVGVAVLAGSGAVYAGGNCEFANFDSTCAENTAIAAMTSAGDRYIDAIVVVGPVSGDICMPCGRCRQRIQEFADAKTRIYALKPDGRPGRVFTMAQLLPHAFGPQDMAAVGLGPAAKKKSGGKKAR